MKHVHAQTAHVNVHVLAQLVQVHAQACACACPRVCTCTRWEVTRETRQSGNSQGTTDLYYHSGPPRHAGVQRFRSRAEVARHFGLLTPTLTLMLTQR